MEEQTWITPSLHERRQRLSNCNSLWLLPTVLRAKLTCSAIEKGVRARWLVLYVCLPKANFDFAPLNSRKTQQTKSRRDAAAQQQPVSPFLFLLLLLLQFGSWVELRCEECVCVCYYNIVSSDSIAGRSWPRSWPLSLSLHLTDNRKNQSFSFSLFSFQQLQQQQRKKERKKEIKFLLFFFSFFLLRSYAGDTHFI